jgi:hypothetical protein
MDGLHGCVAVMTEAGRRQGIGATTCRALPEKGANIFFNLTFFLSFLLGAPYALVGIFG